MSRNDAGKVPYKVMQVLFTCKQTEKTNVK